MARRATGARLLDDARRSVRARHAARPRGERRRPRRGVPPSRSVSGGRRLLPVGNAAPARRAERPDGVPDRADARLGAGAGRTGGVAQLLRVQRPAPAGWPRLAPPGPRRDPRPRQALPAAAALLVQPEVLPGLAAALPLRRAADRPAARRARVPARRVAPRSAR